MRSLCLSLTAVAALATGLPAHGQQAAGSDPAATQAFALDEIVFSATRIPTARDSTGSAVTVIGREDIARAGDRQLADTLGRQPGVSMAREGTPGGLTQLRIRGATPRYTATFVDGIRVDDPTGIRVEFDFGALGTGDVGRVEILRGSQSSLWGGSAVAGVINITTLEAGLEDGAEGIGQTLAVEGGSFGTLSARYGITRRGDRGSVSFNLSHLRSDGFSSARAGSDPDGIRTTRASLSFRHALSETLTLGGAAFHQQTRSEFDGFPPPAFTLADEDNVQRRRETGARIFAEFALGASTQEIGLSVYGIQRRVSFVASDPNRFKGDRWRLDWVGNTVLSPELTLVYGADISRESFETILRPRETTQLGGAFAQALWAPRPDLDISVSGRADHNSDFGTFASGRLAVAWRPLDGLTLRGAMARGFRAPSPYERFGDTIGTFEIRGNPDVGPETSNSFELGADYRFVGGARLSATLFRLDIEDAIDFVFAAPSFYDNLTGRSRREGLELEASVPMGDRLTLTANYTYTDARTPDGARLGRVPRHEAGMALDTQLTDRLRNTTTLRAMADRPADPAGPLRDFTVVHTQFGYALTDRVDLSLRVENLFNTQYQLAAGYGTSDRAVYVGLASRF